MRQKKGKQKKEVYKPPNETQSKTKQKQEQKTPRKIKLCTEEHAAKNFANDPKHYSKYHIVMAVHV